MSRVLSKAKILVTGGMGFMGSAFIRHLIKDPNFTGRIINLDIMSYAADEKNLEGIEEGEHYRFIQGDIQDEYLLFTLFREEQFDTIVHFAAESHVDRSIEGPKDFLMTNVIGTSCLLELVRRHPKIHFHHISTDEVYGALGHEGVFTEQSPYRPNSPYSASKAASDHLVRSYIMTYGISATISHSSNNFGPGQHEEKLIPQMIKRLLHGEPLTLYGNGENVRDWIFVDDHAKAVSAVIEKGHPGEVYNIGGENEWMNRDLIHLLVELFGEIGGVKTDARIIYVKDRPGHDFRYAIDPTKIFSLGWRPEKTFRKGLKETILWWESRLTAPVEL